MKFTQLRLTGFKSFVDPTELRIDPGLTGVIGPNGCGKSNLLEALRWVMGATSAKSLRGGGMEDVIFSGTDNRPARNHAEVLLTVDNSDKLAPARFNDAASLDVSRRITRGAGSAYKINGEEVRAKDVQLLFADAGTGANSAALVRQGQISELIAAKPENRRRILEEAAGVAGLRARRHEAELRLRGAETNLDRLQEVIDEIGSRHTSLQKQARQASRYRKLSASIRTLEATVWLNRWRAAASLVEESEAILVEKRESAETATAAASEARIQAEILAAMREPARLKEAEAAAALRHLERERDRIERDAADVQRSIASLESRLDELASAAGREQHIVDDATASRDEAAKEVERLEAEMAREKTSLAGAEAAALDADTQRRSKEALLDTKAGDAAARQAGLESARRDAERLAARLGQIDREIETAAREREALLASSALSELETAEAALHTRETAHEAAKTAFNAAELARQDAEAEQQVAIEAWRELSTERDSLAREAATIERLLASALQDNVSPALDAVRARPGYEHALAAALGDDLDASLDESAARHWHKTDCHADALPGGCVPLSDHVEAPAALRARLDAVGVIKPEKAAAAAAKLKPGQRLVTREGDLWRWDGLVARADAPSAAVARLEQRNRLDAVGETLAASEAGFADATARRDTAQSGLAAARQAEQSARAAIAPAERAIREAQTRITGLRETAARASARADALGERLERLSLEAADGKTALTAAQAVVETAALAGEDTAALERARESADKARRAAADARAALESVRRESELRRQRHLAARRDRDAWAERCQAAAERIEQIAGQVSDTKAALEQAIARPETLQQSLHALTDRLESAGRAASEAREAPAGTEDELKAAESAARSAENAASAAREGRAAAEARLGSARDRLGETTERLQDATGEDPAALSRRVTDEDIDSPGTGDVERRLDEARQARDRLGAVNLRADEEAEELAKRVEDMSRERDDLLAAIDRLRKAVDQLSREGRARLLEAFEVVDAHFRTLFATLFEGGHAELRLTENDDPLEAGLEIFACPPGKKMETMSLMSGGEQALTASALIFAVFLSNPAPVCVLDEVDAPLDDANVDRYCRMLNEMRRMTDTRFLVITHNPLTMSRMDRLYGVTMSERGVSQLVSVDLVGAEQLVAAE
ncbi:chromosome segregation protein SMC [Maricaulis sp.]|uniref:chromosome segregation protein SMC n=1 Tax=Maricaulis sp. TaxID=1486257 RepID=UPI003A93C93B